MDTSASDRHEVETLTRLLAEDLHTIGSVTYQRRLQGFALFEDGVMFGFVEADGTAYLRASLQSAERFHHLGGTKHPEMPYWSVPHAISSDVATLRELAYEAADTAHIAASFGIDDSDSVSVRERPTTPIGVVATTFALLAA